MEDLKIEDHSEAARIREKLKETCHKNSRTRQNRERAKGPIVVKHNVQLFSPVSPRQVRRKSQDNDVVSPMRGLEKLSDRSPNLRRPSPQQNRANHYGINRMPRHRSPSFTGSRHTSPSSPFSSQSFHQRRRTPSPGNLFDPQQAEIIQKRLNKIPKVRFYLLRQPGPNSFLITADSTENKYKVIIGPQSCTCGKGPHCLHLLFVMVRVLQVKESDSYIWSKTLKNYEVEGLFRKYHKRRKSRVAKMNFDTKNENNRHNECDVDGNFTPDNESTKIRNLSSNTLIEEESLCPICLLHMNEKEALVECQNGCRNKLHHHCISIWAEECLRQNEPIICPLCRAHWTQSPDLLKESLSCSTPAAHVPRNSQAAVSGPGPPLTETAEIVADRHLPLPRADPIPDCYRESAKPWIEVFGSDLVACFYSRDWAVRETAIRRLTREIVTVLIHDSEQNSRTTFRGHLLDHKIPTSDKEILLKACSSILTLVANDPVYKVYTACLRCLRALLAYSYCRTNHDITFLQSLVKPVLETIILRCADGNRRTSQLSIATVLELCRGQNGALAVGNLSRQPAFGGLGGINFVLICTLKKPSQQEVTWQWLLGRLCLINRLIEEFSKDFCLQYVSILQSQQRSFNDENSEQKLLNNERLYSVLKFSLDSVNHAHTTVNKMARRVFVQAARLCSSIPVAFAQVYEMLSTVDSSLQTQLKKKIINSLQNLTNEFNVSKCQQEKTVNAVKYACRRGSIGGDREKCLLQVTLNDNVETRRWKNCLPSHNYRIQRSSSHSPNRVVRNSLNPSPLRQTQNSCTKSSTPISNHVPKIYSKSRQPSQQKPLKRPNHLPLLNKTSQLLPCKSSCSPDNKTSKIITNHDPGLKKFPKETSPLLLWKQASENDSLMDCSEPHLYVQSPSIQTPQKKSECPTGDLIDLTPSSPDSGWSASFKSEVQSPNTPSVAPVFPASPAKYPDVVACEKKLDEAMMLSLVISSHDPPQESLPEIPGLSKEAAVDPAFIIHIQPEMEVDKQEDDVHKGTYQQHLHWNKGPLLGTGAFSTCFQARDIKSGTLMAVKQAAYCRNSEEEQDKVMLSIKKEIMMMAKLDHPNVVRILGATQQGGHFNMFFEWMSGGSIAGLLDKYGPFTESVVFNYTAQVLDGLAYLHDNHILHRDLKGANLLVDSTGRHLRIGDFGAAARLASQATVTGEFQGQLLGTIAFMAPEVLRGEDYGRSCDIWSVGCVIIEMVTSRPPWNANDISNHLALMFKIARAVEPPPIPEYLSIALKSLILQCLVIKSDDRPSAKELIKLFNRLTANPD